MPCAEHSWWFDTPCPKCDTAAVTIAADIAIPHFLERDATNELPDVQVLWDVDNLFWAEAPRDAKAGDEFEWAGKRFRVVKALRDQNIAPLRLRRLDNPPARKAKVRDANPAGGTGDTEDE